MKIPVSPPATGNDTSSRFWQELESKLAPLEDSYLHWDTLQHKTMPVQGINHKQWWQLLKAKRRAGIQALPFQASGQSMYWVLDDKLLKALTLVSRQLTITLPQQFSGRLPANNFLEEAVVTCQLASIPLTREYGLDLLCSGRPKNCKVDTWLEDAYQTLHDLAPTDLSVELLLKLNQQLSHEPGWRSTDFTLTEVGVDLFQAPAAADVASLLEAVCTFANQDDDVASGFMHPIIKAIILHYVVAYAHPFHDANGRTARAVFYWQMLRAGYSFMQVVSLSQVLLENKEAYYQAFLLCQTDGNDLTYFIMQQLESLQSAITHCAQQLSDKAQAMHALPDALTLRQQFILSEMRQHSERQYRLARYKQRMQITYETSRTDLMKLAKKGMVKKHKEGKAFIYSVS